MPFSVKSQSHFHNFGSICGRSTRRKKYVRSLFATLQTIKWNRLTFVIPGLAASFTFVPITSSCFEDLLLEDCMRDETEVTRQDSTYLQCSKT